jgi:methionyl-tRNA formyltransferase
LALTALFLGSPSPVPVAVVARWLACGHRIAAFWTAAGHDDHWRFDRRLGRVAPQWSLASQLRAAGVPRVEVPRLARWPDAVRLARETGADVLISAYFHHVVPPEMLALFPGRAFNIHPSQLPRYRGPTPLQGMILDRAPEAAGVTLHLLDRTLDTGAIVAQTEIAFPQPRYAVALAHAAADLVDAVPAFLAGRIAARPQDESRASYVRVNMAEDFVLTADLTAEAIAWRCRTMPYLRAPAIRALPGRDAIGFVRELGPPTGAPPKSRWFSGDFDAADRRVRVRLRFNGWRRLERWRHFLMLRRTPVLRRT